ncbi:MAG: sulfur carrier protein ThiS [Planctomycetaceae bacterium]|jgi:thiamine biosynthesis protein ThiS|nr:sulfur carrier protein ThiS [Planctomycetaceae bacterium]
MKLSINGESREFDDALTITDLIEKLGLKGKFVAVERNKEVISYKSYTVTPLDEGDQLEIVTLVGGG